MTKKEQEAYLLKTLFDSLSDENAALKNANTELQINRDHWKTLALKLATELTELKNLKKGKV